MVSTDRGALFNTCFSYHDMQLGFYLGPILMLASIIFSIIGLIRSKVTGRRIAPLISLIIGLITIAIMFVIFLFYSITG